MQVAIPRNSLSASLAHAAFKAVAARFRRYRLAPAHSNWAARAEVCERCPLRVVQCNRSYCGKPYLQQVNRDPAVDGCGCPTHAKAKDPAEHCPIDRWMSPTVQGEVCTCKWCAILPT